MPKRVYVTREIPGCGICMLKDKGYEVEVNMKPRPLTPRELTKKIRKGNYDAVLSLLSDKIDSKIFDVAPQTKIYANYAVGFDNIDLVEAKKRGIVVTNTPGGSSERVAEHAFALMMSLACRIVEGDKYMRDGKYKGWDPMLLWGRAVIGETLGIIGTGRIGGRFAELSKAFGMRIVYYDLVRNEKLEKDLGAEFMSNLEDVLKTADIVSLHVPFNEGTRHLINEDRLKMMKKDALLINTSRGAVIDENALVKALSEKWIAGAGLDVFEFEPKMAKGLAKLQNVILTPHIASATDSTREDMAKMAVTNIIEFLEGRTPPNVVD